MLRRRKASSSVPELGSAPVWSPSDLFYADQDGYWAGGYNPGGGRLWVSSTTPVMLPGELIFRADSLHGNTYAEQDVAGSRPALVRWPKGGRRNLFTRTADLSHADWWKYHCEVSGTLVTSNVDNGYPQIRQTAIPITTGQTITVSVEAWVEPGNANQALTILTTSIPGGGNNPRTSINLVTGAVTNANGGVGSSALLPNGHRRVQWQWTATGTGTLQVNLYVGPFAPQPTGRAVNMADPQIEIGAVQTAYQTVVSANDVTEPGVPDVWHLWDDGGDSLPVTLPAGTYGRAVVDHLGAVTVDTVTDPANALVAQRQADVILRSGAFTPDEIERIESYWSSRYLA